MKEITAQEASEYGCEVHINWNHGTLLVLKVCGFDRVGMVLKYLLDEERDEVCVRLLMIDTVLAYMSGSSAYATFPVSAIQGRMKSWDLLSMRTLMLPSTDDLKGQENE